MRIIKAKNYEDLSNQAANIIAAQVILKPNSVLGLATGSTPIGAYNGLIERNKNGECDFSAVRTVNLDEYCGLASDNDQSYNYFMHYNLFDHINIDPANVHLPNGLAPDADAECARYEALIESLGGVDLQLLGIGHNGHIGFNEPSDSFPTATNLVGLQQSTIDANKRFFESADDVPRQAYTMGIQTIMRAKRVLLIATGKEKAGIVKQAFSGPVTPQVPASVLQLHSNVILVADEDALSAL